ncbi:MAG: methylmalonyl-CoA mutase small subunit [Bacteroidales bacterium]
MAENKEKLFDQFPAVSTAEWKAKVEVDLKGADFQKKLVWRTNEGFDVQPMYRAEDIADLKTTNSLPGEYPFIRGTKDDNNWKVRQEISVKCVEEANAKAKDILTKGITSICFSVCKESIDAKSIEALLAGINLSEVEINFNCCACKATTLATSLVEYLKANDLCDTFNGAINFSPFNKLLKKGKEFSKSIAEEAIELINIVADVKKIKVLSVDSYKLNNAGSYIAQELGYALAWGSEWISMLTEAGLSVDAVAKRIKFNMGISSNYFMELAKFRAARMLWAQIVKQYNPECECSCKMMIHASTSEFNQTIYDAHVNLLRSQTEAMSAALAGVDSITVLPFDIQYQTADEFSERIARNQQLLLKEESRLDKIVDPAGGSYYVETLTVSIAQEAWKLFLAVEEDGGFYAAAKEGKVQAAVNASAEKRLVDVSRRKEVLLGSNQFPNFTETAKGKIQPKCACGCGSEAGEVATLSTKRASSEFEDLRLATESAEKTPKVFMLTIGNLAMRLARSQFSANFFGCAGYQIIDNLGFNTVTEGIEAAMAKEADIIVLCSSDDEYTTLAPEAYKVLDGRALFVVAGAPACAEELKAQGITEFINVRTNVLNTLKAFNAKLLK